MARPYWKGYLKLSLVTCPVTMAPATSEAEKVKFHTLNAATGNRVVSRYVDAVTGKEVDDDDEVKGYERGEDEYVMLEDDELESVALESTRTIDIDMFVPADTIEWIWLEKPHFLTPGDPVGEEAYSVIREAMKATDMVGISRLVIGRRERAVMLEARENGIVLWTLRYGGEVRDEENYFGSIASDKADPSAMPLIQQLIKQNTKSWDPAMASDPIQIKLLDIIAEKKKTLKKPKTAKAKSEVPAASGNVVNIMDALKASLARDTGRKRAS